MSDTQFEMVPIAEPGLRPPRGIHLVWSIPLAAVGFAVIALLLVSNVLSAGVEASNDQGVEAEYAIVPAEAEPGAGLISFEAVPRYDSAGQLLFVTVREPEISLLDWFVGGRQTEVNLLSKDDKFGVQTPDQQRQINLQMMRSAKETSEYVALHALGYPAEIVPGDVIVGQLVCLKANEAQTECVQYAPSGDVLEVGDKLLSVDGKDLTVIDDLTPILAGKQPGDVITIDYDRPGVGKRSDDVALIASPEDPTRTIIGFVPFDTATAKLPFAVDIDSGAIGGPSAGLSFTLTLIDELTPGDLTGGNKVAVTGTIDINGNVGAIGGLPSKASAVKQRGATLFIVPASQSDADLAAARKVAGDDLKIVTVSTLDEALAALADVGGNGLELGQPGADYHAD